MTSSARFTIPFALCAIAAVFATGISADAADRRDADAVSAEFFDAMDSGQIDVRVIPKDATQANVLIRNMTDKPLHLRLPKTFATVPILRQMGGGMGGGGMGGGGGGMGGGGGGGGQAGGGGMGGGGGGMGGGGGGMGGGMGGGGGGMMRVPPERMKKLKVTTVCLEHGKPDPNPKMAYTIVPLEQFSSDPKIAVICEALGYGQVPQNTAQATAWHIMDGLSWQDLAMKNRIESKYTGNVRWFSQMEMQMAVAVFHEASRIAEERQEADPEASEQDAEPRKYGDRYKS